MDLIDEVLEGAHLLKAFDSAKVPPPKSFRSWVSQLKLAQVVSVVSTKNNFTPWFWNE
jgi:hypothetical protein